VTLRAALLALAALAAAAPVSAQAVREPGFFAGLPGWTSEDHAAALAAFRQTCGVATDPAMAALASLLIVFSVILLCISTWAVGLKRVARMSGG